VWCAFGAPAGALRAQNAAPPLTLLTADGRRPIPVSLVNNQERLALDDIAPIFQLTVREEAGALTVSHRGRTVVLTPDQALASVSGRLISLPAAPVRSGNRWFVPLEFLNRALAPIYEAPIELRRPSRLVIVGTLTVPRLVVRQETQGQATRFIFEATPRAPSTIAQEPSRLAITFEADALDLSVPALQPQGLASGLRLVEPATIAIDLGPRFGSFRASTQTADNMSRLTIDLVPVADTTTGAPPAAPAAGAPAVADAPPAPTGELPVFGAPAFSLRTVVIDPGHGGDDRGVRGSGNTEEKAITLSVARRLKGLLESRLGLRVLLTRDDDRTTSVEQRTAMANNNKADLFLSLHANASPRPEASGASIYVAAFDTGEQTQSPAGPPERVPVFGGGSRDIELVPWEFAQSKFVDRSLAFAGIAARHLQGRVPLNDRAVHRAPFRVLEAANMPAILVEMGYLTHPAQEKQLAGAELQTAIAAALYGAIVEFRDQRGGGDANSPGAATAAPPPAAPPAPPASLAPPAAPAAPAPPGPPR
jgi:N-acetylmuramoyl-L-alanine amidase